MNVADRNRQYAALTASRNALSIPAPVLLLPPPETVRVNVPFNGFYETWWDATGEEERNLREHWAGGGLDDDTQLSLALGGVTMSGDRWDKVEELLSDTCDFGAYKQAVAEKYAEAFCWKLSEFLDVPAVYHSGIAMTSPRYYNFSTDQIDIALSVSTMQAIADHVRREHPEALAEAVKLRHTSRSGFISFIDNDPEPFMTAALDDLCIHQLGTIMRVFTGLFETKWECMDGLVYSEIADSGDSAMYTAWSNAVDWDKFYRLLGEQADEWREEDGEDLDEQPYRCPRTLELPLTR